jgi:acetylornithine deacetylase/succinyl-diaminopimelate desuccinylase-like protein
VLPVSAEATVQCRLLPGDTVEGVRAALVKVVADDRVEVVPSTDWGAETTAPADGVVPDAVRRVTRAYWPDVPVVEGFGFGANDSRYVGARGTLAYGLHPNPRSNEDGRLGFSAHGPDERVPVRWYAEGVRWLNAVVLDLAR